MTPFKLILAPVIAAAISLPAGAATAQDVARTYLTIDLSGSSTFAQDPLSAEAAARYVERYIARLDAPHILRMTSLGDPGLVDLAINIEAQVTDLRASSAERMAAQFGQYVRAIPGMIARGELSPQGSSSILAYFATLDHVCREGGDVTILLFTDGIEWSAQFDGLALVSGQVSLPGPDTPFLAGCSVQMHGIGQLRDNVRADGIAERLIPEWQRYLEAAGAAPVIVTGAGFAY